MRRRKSPTARSRFCLFAACSLLGCGGVAPSVAPPPELGRIVATQARAHIAAREALPAPVEAPSPPLRPATPLTRLFAKLESIDAGAQSTHARILQIGDSHTASDTFSGPLRAALSERFGSGGRGYLYAGRPWDGYRQQHAEYDAGGQWTGTLGVRRRWEAPLSMGGARIDAGAAGDWFVRQACADCGIGEEDTSADVFYYRAPDAGRFVVSTAGGETVEVDARGEAGLGHVHIGSEGPIALRVEVQAPPVSFFGTSTLSARSGVIVDSLGMNGGRADQWERFDDSLARAEIEALAPDLVIVAFGTNEAFGDSYRVGEDDDAERRAQRLAQYATDYGALLDRYTLDGTGAACLVLLPMDFHDRDADRAGSVELGGATYPVQMPPSSLGTIAAVQAQVAGSRGCAIWDAQAAMGGPGSMSIWRSLSPALGASDAVHLSSRGYARLAQTLAADLIATYEAWRAGQATALETSEAHEGVRDALEALR